MAKNGQYYVTEQEIAKLLGTSGLPMAFTNQFTKDYAAVKNDIGTNTTELEQIRVDIDSLDSRVDVTEAEIASINSDITSLNSSVTLINSAITDIDLRVEILESDLPALESEFEDHVADTVAHGSTGDIVGTDDFCTALIGGTVLEAASVAPVPASTLSITSTPNAAGAAYVQADAATWVAMLNEIKTDFNALIVEYNALRVQLNLTISTEITANQRAP